MEQSSKKSRQLRTPSFFALNTPSFHGFSAAFAHRSSPNASAKRDQGSDITKDGAAPAAAHETKMPALGLAEISCAAGRPAAKSIAANECVPDRPQPVIRSVRGGERHFERKRLPLALLNKRLGLPVGQNRSLFASHSCHSWLSVGSGWSTPATF